MGLGKFFLTGPPGSGKSTVFLRCIDLIRGTGFTVGGISTPEIRSRGRRVGFSVVDLATGDTGVLAGVEVDSRLRVGRYGVDLIGFESVALPALDHAEEKCDLVCIDEIGRMELFSARFERRVEELLGGPKPMQSVLHRNYVGRYGGWGEIFRVSPENRDGLPKKVASVIEAYLKGEAV